MAGPLVTTARISTVREEARKQQCILLVRAKLLEG